MEKIEYMSGNTPGESGFIDRPGERITYAAAVGKRREQEDSWAVDASNPAQLVAVVCDGLGGHEDGAAASRTAAEIFIETAREFTKKRPAPAAADAAGAETHGPDLLEAGLAAAHARIVELTGEGYRPRGMATTLVGAVLNARGLAWINVGDSTIRLRRGGGLEELNRRHNQRGHQHALSSAVMKDGMFEIGRSRGTEPLKGGDVLLLASDGLDTLSGGEAGALAAAHGHRTVLAAELVREVESRGKERQDNTTVVGIHVLNDRPPKA